MKPVLAISSALFLITACDSSTPRTRHFISTVEGVQMSVTATGDRAEVHTVERGTTVGKYRRGLLAEIEVAQNLLCSDVNLLEQSEETVNATTRATLVYELADCRGY